MSERCLQAFLKLTHDLTGVTIAANRGYMLEGRLRRRVTTLALPGYDAYLELVRSDGSEQAVFIDLVTTNETYFFRTPRIWEFIEKRFLPAWLERHPKQVFLAWSAAASSGEEAHSLGIVCQAFRERHPSFLYQILGTDISQEMVSLCQRGEYSGRSIESFRSTRREEFQRYMKAIGAERFQAVPEIRSRLRFQRHNLFGAFPTKDRFDLILLRNVLIYFTARDQETVLEKLRPRLAEDGALIIGESESLSHIQSAFGHVEPLVYRRNDGVAA